MTRRRSLLSRLTLALAVIVTSAAAVRADEVVLFAAASTKDVVQAVARRAAARGVPPITVSFASSGALAKQIENGAPADLYLSADPRWTDYLAERGLLAPGGRTDLLGNRLVLIAPGDGDWSIDLVPGAPLAEALGDGWLAMGDPAHVPAGRYGRAALDALGLWPAIAPRVARTNDVRAALALVARGEAAAGIVYATDAAAASGVRVVDVFPTDTHPTIVYPLARIAGRDRPEIRAVHDFLTGPEARALFAEHGFGLAAVASPESG